MPPNTACLLFFYYHVSFFLYIYLNLVNNFSLVQFSVSFSTINDFTSFLMACVLLLGIVINTKTKINVTVYLRSYKFLSPVGKVEPPKKDHTVVVACSAAAMVAFILLLCVLCHRKRRRRRPNAIRRPFQLPIPAGSSRRQPQHVCEELGERFASVDSV